MIIRGARCNAGHFFRKILPAVFLWAVSAGCGGEPAEVPGRPVLPDAGELTILFEFTGDTLNAEMPESLNGLENTSWGRFHIFEEEPLDVFPAVFYAADRSGLLILAVVPESLALHGTRDHLLIRTGPEGNPVGTEPEMDSSFTAESLWANPLVMQETILVLSSFFKPDIILVSMNTPSSIREIVEFWNGRSTITCFYQQPDGNDFRGWGAFCGTGIRSGPVEGMTPSNYLASVLMTAGLEWYGTGYPCMHIFKLSEIE